MQQRKLQKSQIVGRPAMQRVTHGTVLGSDIQSPRPHGLKMLRQSVITCGRKDHRSSYLVVNVHRHKR